MRIIITTFNLILLVSSICFAQQDLFPAYPDEISYSEGVAYFKGTPFTGALIDKRTNKKIGEFRNGYKNGIFIDYYDNKQKKSSYNYNNGNIIGGDYFIYAENGQIEKEETYKGGKLISYREYDNGKLSDLMEASIEQYSNGKKKSEGWLKNGNKEGLWKMWYENGITKSEGNYKDGLETGKWRIFFQDGTLEYEGELKEGLKDGIGILHNYEEGITYSGSWKNNMKDGFGTITWDNGFINYQGYFKNGLPDGKGITYNKGKKVYDGEWENGKKHGKGYYTYTTPEGSLFLMTGDFVNDEFKGQGKMILKNNNGTVSSFTGEFKNWGLYNGIFYDIFPSENKDIYTIEYKNGIKVNTNILRNYSSDVIVLSCINPSINSLEISSIAIFPLNNKYAEQNISTNRESMSEIDNMILNEMSAKNPKTRIIIPKTSSELLHNEKLDISYDSLLENYFKNTNIPSIETLHNIGETLNIDAIIQGFLVKVFMRNGRFFNPSYQGQTKLIIQYVMISTNSGDVLWETTCIANEFVSSLKDAPSLSDMSEMIKEKFTDVVPVLLIKK